MQPYLLDSGEVGWWSLKWDDLSQSGLAKAASPAPQSFLLVFTGSAFLQPVCTFPWYRNPQSRHAMERYTAGLLADIPVRQTSDLGRGCSGTNGQRLQEFLTNTEWDSRDMDQFSGCNT